MRLIWVHNETIQYEINRRLLIEFDYSIVWLNRNEKYVTKLATKYVCFHETLEYNKSQLTT